jgi:glyoxylase-like metal-dependent hydrolase (beta-lactamase superfamily II)
MGDGMLPGILQWKIGDQIVTTLNDGFNQASLDVIQGLDRDEAIKIQRASFRTDQPKITINVFLIQGSGHKPILVDTGMGFIGGETSGRLLPALERVGIFPEDIGTILLTHLHPDHSAGLSDGNGRVMFPNAEVVMNKNEHAFWTNDGNFPNAPDEYKGIVSLTQASIAPYRDRTRLFDGEDEVLPNIASVPLYGHTPGHTGYQVGSGGSSILIWGDIVQFPEVQSRKPDAGLAYDVDRFQAAETRKAIMNEAAEKRLLVAGMHIDFPAFSFVERAGEGFRLVPALWTDYV